MKWTDNLKSFLLATIVIPTNNLTDWKIEQFSNIPKNEVTASSKGLLIKVNKSAAPLIFPLKTNAKISGFKVSGNFSGLPKLAKPSQQGDKGFDDYPLRVGFVIPGEKRHSGLKKVFAAEWVKRLFELVQDRSGLDSVRFYNVTQNLNQLGQERTHPSSELLHENFFAFVKNSGPFTYEQRFKKELDIAAIWISIDGDDTKSSYEVTISQLELFVE